MRCSRWTFSCSLALAVCLASAHGRATEPPEDAAEYRLAYKFSPNQFVRYSVDYKMQITTRYSEASETVRNESAAEKHFRVVSVDEQGNAFLEPVLDRVRMSARFGEHEPTIFDSTHEGPHPHQFEGILEAIGKPLARMQVSPHGELLKVTTLVKPAGGDSPGGNPTDPSYNFLAVLPREPVRVGDTWKDRISVPVSLTKTLNRQVTLQRTYTLKAVDGPLATIQMRMTVLTPIHDPAISAQLIQRTPSGTILFDIERGLIVSRTQEIDKMEIGAFGSNSSMHAVSSHVERLLDPVGKKGTEATAAEQEGVLILTGAVAPSSPSDDRESEKGLRKTAAPVPGDQPQKD